jgi:hypothetical protein
MEETKQVEIPEGKDIPKGWILSDERLPETYDKVLCYFMREKFTGYYRAYGWANDDCRPVSVSHWQPLPDDPE